MEHTRAEGVRAPNSNVNRLKGYPDFQEIYFHKLRFGDLRSNLDHDLHLSSMIGPKPRAIFREKTVDIAPERTACSA